MGIGYGRGKRKWENEKNKNENKNQQSLVPPVRCSLRNPPSWHPSYDADFVAGLMQDREWHGKDYRTPNKQVFYYPYSHC